MKLWICHYPSFGELIMSKGMFIPIEYLYNADENEFKECVGHSVTLSDTGKGIYYHHCHTLTFHGRALSGQPGVTEERTVDIYPRMNKEDPSIIEGFSLSAWQITCEDVIKYLKMPADTEIW